MGELDLSIRTMTEPANELAFVGLGPWVKDSAFINKPPAVDDPNREKIVVVIPAYNEERFIGTVVLKALRHAATVIVVDDGSADCTAEVAAETGAVVVKHTHNRGKGAALNTGFELARMFNPQVLVMMDADGQHLPEQLAKVVEPILAGKADIVVGSRYLEPTSDVPVHRIWGHWAFNLLTRLSSGVSATDSQSGYRAFSTTALEKIDFCSSGFSVESEMQFIAREFHLRLVEVPITIRYLDKPKRSVIRQGFNVLNGVTRLVGQYRPLLFFSLPGGVSLLGGIVWGLYVVDRFNQTHVLATGYALICLMLSIMGLVLLSTGFTLHSMRGLVQDLLSKREH